jgi:hypothetical protein
VTRRARVAAWAALALIAVAFIVARQNHVYPRPFLDAYTPPQPYRWVSPPPAFRHGNQAPSAGEALVALTNGVSDPASAFTDDGQVTVSFNPGSFKGPPNETAVHVVITPVSPQPKSPSDIVADGNAYRIDATYVPSGSGPAALQLPVLIDLRYPGHQPDAIYRIDGTTWTPIGGTAQVLVLAIDTRSLELGTFIAGHQATVAAQPTSAINPITIGLVVLAIIGLSLIAGVRLGRRR